MSEIVTLELPEILAQRAREVAARTHRRVEDVLLEWIDRAIVEPPVESLSDAQVLALCDLQMDSAQQEELNDLLARNREGPLGATEQTRLEELMQVYRHGLVRKAQALQVAVARGLHPSLG